MILMDFLIDGVGICMLPSWSMLSTSMALLTHVVMTISGMHNKNSRFILRSRGSKKLALGP